MLVIVESSFISCKLTPFNHFDGVCVCGEGGCGSWDVFFIIDKILVALVFKCYTKFHALVHSVTIIFLICWTIYPAEQG